ncbi:hypothetical protein [Streptomyces sp. V1I1]|uniref:hypothetical protein n=1 Tax=Streptomyces sp. V1I1 TaxID=3042272 RepID=UPI0027884E63|nr:hypothetical protein [Streptomyces sp. V1I1]MDQ0941067.1 hypothetical protein [Streptomyces sp. V1I1]
METGGLRLIGKQEAEEVGLLDGTYRQAWMSEYLQELLADGMLPGPGRFITAVRGPLP